MPDGSLFLHYCPKDPLENVQWRLKMRRLAMHDRELQDALRDAAMTDVLFFFNAFLWCFEPRAVVKTKPFVTWPHQDPAILELDQSITDSEKSEEPVNILLKKSRAQGGTLMYLGVGIRRWLRDPLFSMGLVTRNEKLVDSARDPDAILWKVNWMLGLLPQWMLPKGFDFEKHRSLSEHTIFNPENGATFAGYAATGDVGRGGRKGVFALDEIGREDFVKTGDDYRAADSTAAVTHCRWWVSTFGTDCGVFAETIDEPGDAKIITLDWKDNPTQNRLAYVMKEGMPVPVNPDDGPAISAYAKENADRLKKIERRGFKMEGSFRSPWYDRKCLEPGATPRGVARELDMNPKGAVGKVMSVDVLDRMKKEHVRQPDWRGKLVYDPETFDVRGLIQQDNGPLKLWFRPGVDNSAPMGDHVVGFDIAAGTDGGYSSNSSAVGCNRRTGEQVLEYASPAITAVKFGRLGVAICRWLNNAYMVWEANGPTGVAFAKVAIEEARYGNVFYRRVAEVSGLKRKGRKPGWWNASESSLGDLFEQVNIAMEENEFIPHSEDLIREFGEYEWDSGKIVHKPTKIRGEDNKAHGDRAVAAGVMWVGYMDRPMSDLDSYEEMRKNPPYGSAAWCRQREERTQERFDPWAGGELVAAGVDPWS
jgi:hypothetical protein